MGPTGKDTVLCIRGFPYIKKLGDTLLYLKE